MPKKMEKLLVFAEKNELIGHIGKNIALVPTISCILWV